MERIGEAHQVHQLQQVQQQQQGVAAAAASFGVVEHSVVAAAAAAAKPRAPGLPPTPPASFAGQQRGDVCMDDSSGAAGRKQAQAHRRTRSDVPFAGYFPPPTHQLPQPKAEAGGWGDGGGDDLFSFSSYLNLEGMDVLNSSSPDSSAKADSSENGDSEECAAWGVKRSAAGEPAMAGRHARSLSVDSLMGRLNFASPGAANGAASGMFSLEFGSGEFSPAEMKKIMADEKLAEMALADPKRVKRVLANRQSAARSKERKMRYIVELEQKVQILQTEATTLSAQLNLLQRDSAAVATQNNELRFRLQAMEQQAQLRDALNDALTGEVQRLKIVTAELGVGGDSCSSNGMAQQHNHMFQQQQQATPIPFYQLQHQQQQQQQQQQNGTANKHESRE